MADGTIGVAQSASPDRLVDNEQLTVGANTVYRQRTQLGGAAAAEIARVLNSAPAGTEYALVTRNVPSGTQAASIADGSDVAQGATTDAEATGNGSIVAILKRLRTLLAGGLPASLGQKAMAASLPVVVASDQSPVSVQGWRASRTAGSITTSTSVVGPATVTYMNVVTVTLSGATFAGVSFVFEGSDDGGTTYYPIQGCRTDAALMETGATTLGNANAPRAWDVPVGGIDLFRVRATAWTSGTASIGINGQVFPYDPSPAVGLAQVAGTAASVNSGLADAGTLRVIQGGPATANILVGQQAQTATTAAATIITVPANRTWVGTVTVSCDVAIAAASTTAGQALGTIATAGATVTPAAATVFTVEARAGANAATGTVGAQSANTGSIPLVVAAGTSSATLTLASTQAGTTSRVAATASGVLV